MRSSDLPLDNYDSDKIASGFLERYDNMFSGWVDKPITLLELGVYRGGSLLLWKDYFPEATIVGIDLNLPRDFVSTDRIHIFQGDQTDTRFLTEMATKMAPQGFDIIIDDCSHVGELTKVSFWHLFENHLKPGGIYAIEDWGTGYWSDWPDGSSLDIDSYLAKKSTPFPCHSYGMVGFVKQLVDEQGARSITRGCSTNPPQRNSRFKMVTVTAGIVFVEKALSIS